MFVNRIAVGTLTAAVIYGLVLSPGFANAQRISGLRTVSPAPAAVELPKLAPEYSPPFRRGDGEEKSAYVAGVLSFLLPGAGSFYAGNSKHGWTHLLIEGGTFATGFLVAHSCNGELGCGIEVLSGVGAVLIGNQIWSVVSAISDARATKHPANAVGTDATAKPVDRPHDH